jgi:hypothetical protein
VREDWREIDEFPGYYVSNLGRVRSAYTDRLLKQNPIQNNVPAVWLGTGHRRQKCRAVPLLVARTWLPEPERYDFISPIQLDGDRSNCCVENLAWRPRWFSIAYHREFNLNLYPNWRAPIQILETEEIFPHPRPPATKYGVLETDILKSILEETFVFPHWFHFRVVD